MVDYCMCQGGDCPVKDQCYRFTANPDSYMQSYFLEPPYLKQAERIAFHTNHPKNHAPGEWFYQLEGINKDICIEYLER